MVTEFELVHTVETRALKWLFPIAPKMERGGGGGLRGPYLMNIGDIPDIGGGGGGGVILVLSFSFQCSRFNAQT